MLVAFEGARSDADLAELAGRLADQRSVMATWLLEQLQRKRPLRADLAHQDALDTLWVLLDPAVHQRLTQHRGASQAAYEGWIADSIIRLLCDQERPHTARRRRR